MTFRAEVRELIAATFPTISTKEQRDINIASRLYGWDGKGGCSLQIAGQEFNLTRERVRQIAGEVAEKMKAKAPEVLKTVPGLLQYIHQLIPASASRVESELSGHGLGEDRVEGVIKSATLFFKVGDNLKLGDHIRVGVENGVRYVTPPDMEGTATRISAKAQKIVTHVGMVHVNELLPLTPALSEESALAFIRDVLGSRSDAHWLDEECNWVWLSDAPRNRMITCLHKMLHVYSSTTLENIVAGVNRYFRKDAEKDAPATKLEAPLEILGKMINAWGEATVSEAGIVRKTATFHAVKQPTEYEVLLVKEIMAKPEKIAREKELENALVPLVDGKPHPHKHRFSIQLNYSPLVCKGAKRGEYVATGVI